MKSPIDLHIPGDASAIHELSSWVAKLGRVTDKQTDALARMQRDSQYYWEGQSGQAFRVAAIKQMGASQKVPDYAAKAADVFDAYADRLTRGRNSFADYADAASAAGMKVAAKRHIRPPEPQGTDANGDCVPIDNRAQSDYEKAVRLFIEIERLVAAWRTDTTAWVAEHFTPLITYLAEFELLDKILKHFEVNGFTVAGALIDEASNRVSARFGDFTDQQRAYEKAFEQFASDRRSGNPARNAAAEGFDRAGNRSALEAIEKNIDLLRPGKVLLRVGGPATGVIEAAVELAGGESPSTVGAGAAGGATGGWAGAAIGAKAGAAVGAAAGSVIPGLGTAVGGAAGGVLGGIGGGALGSAGGSAIGKVGWQAWVPVRTRDAIDAGLNDEYRLKESYDIRIKPPVSPRG